MFGGNGNDTYIVDNAGDVTSETSALGGIDTVISSVTRNLTANLENLTLTGSANINGAGNALNNVVIGKRWLTPYGLDGDDRLDGGLTPTRCKAACTRTPMCSRPPSAAAMSTPSSALA
ncbi:MAG: hypothetical protein R3C30_08050 [Hyphomonadaceae bacterium]